MTLQVLFVDDDPNILQGLRRMLRTQRNLWSMSFAKSGEEALQLLATNPIDVLVTDMRMPGMDGATLLREVMKRHPSVSRIILSGHSDQEKILRSVGPAHQYLAKPCEAELLIGTIQKTQQMKELLSDERLEGLISQMGSLPTLPSLYLQLKAEMESPDTSMRKVGQIISSDVGMTAKILQLVNSAFFGLPREVVNPGQAVTLLGLEIVRALVLSVGIFSQFDCRKLGGIDQKVLWSHSSKCAAFAKAIAVQEGFCDKQVEESFLAAFLHDIGKLVLAANFSERYAEITRKARRERIPIHKAERQALGITHSEIGAYLVGLWGLPGFLTEIIAFHHRPADYLDQGVSPLSVVHFADAQEHKMSEGVEADFDFDFLKRAVGEEKLDWWGEICLTTTEKEATT